jgi:hypothetical protein
MYPEAKLELFEVGKVGFDAAEALSGVFQVHFELL